MPTQEATLKKGDWVVIPYRIRYIGLWFNELHQQLPQHLPF
ncbi:hypothetical protein B4102_3777 [Heyndrickxia sporothermodurans]|uniref:Uncharacterized protein n=1 Tax=Heyndrickxia sporothermodurans TaxID=46224 RepID=A0A150KLA0_9BACI|nr:hypothetical protein [Heyndrickxia sporothermodurans]KYC92236.1 hypothetical protein B4102_3777 [Heyndrickxia sporothermodurans]